MSEFPPSQRSGAVIGGIILIGLGLIFLLQNLDLLHIGNWWALFILLGTAGAWGNAWHIYRNSGQRITKAVTGAFFGGIFPLAIALIFLLNLNWGMMWPIFLVIAGLALIFGSFAASN